MPKYLVSYAHQTITPVETKNGNGSMIFTVSSYVSEKETEAFINIIKEKNNFSSVIIFSINKLDEPRKYWTKVRNGRRKTMSSGQNV